MKKMLSVLGTIAIIISLCGCGETGTTNGSQTGGSNTQAPTSSENAATTAAETEAEQGGATIKIVGHKLSKDYEDKDVLVVTYEFSHNEDSAKSFTFLFQDKAYQNGVECSSMVIGCDDVDSQKQLNDVKAGVAYSLEIGYILADKSDVEIEIKDFLGQNSYLEETIKLS